MTNVATIEKDGADFVRLLAEIVNFFEILFSFMLAASCPTPVTAANLLPFSAYDKLA
jgi:hypothetical protein